MSHPETQGAHGDHAAVRVTERFSDRVNDYVRYRPGYPEAIISAIVSRAHLRAGSTVADIGSGTGISAAPFLALGCTVYAVEPNGPMRAAAEAFHAANACFHSLSTTAEETGIPAGGIDLVLAAQAFHWFDLDAARREFLRILRPSGLVALAWNRRITDRTPFLKAYEALLHRHAVDYQAVDHRRIDSVVLNRFFNGPYETIEAPNVQLFDLNGLRGRVASSSYVPRPGQPGHAELMEAITALFHEHAQDGRVAFEYVTELHIGRPVSPMP